DGKGGVEGDDRRLGFPAFEAIRKLKPDFFISTGDSVYYDIPLGTRAMTPDAMRRKWREVLLQPRAKELFSTVPTYWEKDDHDTRYDDCDATGDRKPSLVEGIRVFNEQVPVVDPNEPAPKTYRTHRVSKDLQIWLPEGRDYRSPNAMPDGPEKSIWGAEQLAWLKKTLLESKATFKILILPTPMVGPDGPVKRDSHVNFDGFRHERDAFFRWVKEHKLVEHGLLIICGDRHWQYHSIDPGGIEEFSTGAFVTNNARLGVKPGEKDSSDPKATIKQPFTSPKPLGGFLFVTVTPRDENKPATAKLDFYDEQGNVLYSVSLPM
ncbi:MAG: alkaline phosphatase D family protein, partial [Planctomycetes bacterium]|nr:alkaline phosphatase D family protein [Planctomycetota bacterium]